MQFQIFQVDSNAQLLESVRCGSLSEASSSSLYCVGQTVKAPDQMHSHPVGPDLRLIV